MAPNSPESSEVSTDSTESRDDVLQELKDKCKFFQSVISDLREKIESTERSWTEQKRRRSRCEELETRCKYLEKEGKVKSKHLQDCDDRITTEYEGLMKIMSDNEVLQGSIKNYEHECQRLQTVVSGLRNRIEGTRSVTFFENRKELLKRYINQESVMKMQCHDLRRLCNQLLAERAHIEGEETDHSKYCSGFAKAINPLQKDTKSIKVSNLREVDDVVNTNGIGHPIEITEQFPSEELQLMLDEIRYKHVNITNKEVLWRPKNQGDPTKAKEIRTTSK